MQYLDQPSYLDLLFQRHIKPDVTNIYKKIGLFIWFFIDQQILLIISQLTILGKPTPGLIGLINHGLTLLTGTILLSLLIFLSFKQLYEYQSNDAVKNQHKKFVTKVSLSILSIIFLLIIYSIVAITTLHLKHLSQGANQTNLMSYTKNPISLIFLIIFTIVIAPHFEEFEFRYLIITPHPSKKSLIPRIIISDAFFALLHVVEDLPKAIHQPTFRTEWFFNFGLYATIGFVLCMVYAIFHNYRLNAWVHGSWNSIAIIEIILQMLK